jgi:hypothetical protein
MNGMKSMPRMSDRSNKLFEVCDIFFPIHEVCNERMIAP